MRLLKETNNTDWVVYFEKQGRNKATYVAKWKQNGIKQNGTKKKDKKEKPKYINVNNSGKSASYSTL